MARYKTYKVESSPSETLPEMVKISKKIKGKLFEKKFINESKAKAWIDYQAANKLINRGAKKVKSELDSIVVTSKLEIPW